MILGDQQKLSAADDEALVKLAEAVTSLVRDRAVVQFLHTSTATHDEIVDLYQRFGWGSAMSADQSHRQLIAKLTTSIQTLLDLQDRAGIDFSNAKLTVKQVLAEHPSFTQFGQLDGMRSSPVRVTFAVESSGTAKSGQPVAGNYTITLGEVMRANNRWLLMKDEIRWQEIPPGVLAEDDAKKVAFENYIAENHTLPVGQKVPDVEFVRLTDQTRTTLSAYHGKVVVLEFWASWCGPCQEPMEKLQHLREAHPDWKDRVEIITLSIDEKTGEATDHLAKKQWNQTVNAWAGIGGFNSAPARAFHIHGVPTSYVVDREGKIVKAGHPLSMDFETIVEEQLSQLPSSRLKDTLK